MFVLFESLQRGQLSLKLNLLGLAWCQFAALISFGDVFPVWRSLKQPMSLKITHWPSFADISCLYITCVRILKDICHLWRSSQRSKPFKVWCNFTDHRLQIHGCIILDINNPAMMTSETRVFFLCPPPWGNGCKYKKIFKVDNCLWRQMSGSVAEKKAPAGENVVLKFSDHILLVEHGPGQGLVLFHWPRGTHYPRVKAKLSYPMCSFF